MTHLGDDIRRRVIAAAIEGKTIEFWQSELKNNPEYGGLVSQLLGEIDEPED